MRVRIRVGLAALVGALAAAPPARAELQNAGSLLVFHRYDNRPSNETLVSVANTHGTASVVTRWLYVSGDDCLILDRRETLTPGDQLTVLTSAHDPRPTQGYLIVFAEDPSTLAAIVFENLIGSAMAIDGLGAIDHVYNPVVFAGLGDGTSTDVNGNGRPDLDGVEYAPGPDELLFPRFLGQGAALQSELVLLDLSGGLGFTTVVNILLTNDNEELFSAQHAFECWTAIPLDGVSGAFTNLFLQSTNDDPAEIFGAPQQEAGWFRLGGNAAFSAQRTILDPLVLGLVVERDGAGGSSGRPFHFGTQDVGVLPPDCGPGAVVELWPPNHHHVEIDLEQVAGVTDPNGLPFTIAITAITQDEPVDGNGDGNTVCDGDGVGTSVARIRAERQGGGNGRVYVIHFTATNSGGASCDGSIQVVVPHSQDGDPAVDDGQMFDSTEGC
jgi:hypothetical protein